MPEWYNWRQILQRPGQETSTVSDKPNEHSYQLQVPEFKIPTVTNSKYSVEKGLATRKAKDAYNAAYKEYLEQHPVSTGSRVAYAASSGPAFAGDISFSSLSQDPVNTTKEDAYKYAVEKSGYDPGNPNDVWRAADKLRDKVALGASVATITLPFLATNIPDLAWAVGTKAGREVLKKSAINMGASLVGGKVVDEMGRKLTGQPTTGRFVLSQTLGNKGERLYDNNILVQLGSDIITNPGYAVGNWAIKGLTDIGANLFNSVGNKIKINKTIKDALKSGKLKFGEPTIYEGWHQSESPISKFEFPFNRWDVVNHGADPNGAFFTLGNPAQNGFLSKRPWSSSWRIQANKPLIQTGEILSPSGTKNNMRNAIVRYGRRNGADAIEFRGIADNQLQNQNILFATNKAGLNKTAQWLRGKPSSYESPFSKIVQLEYADPVANTLDDINTIISKASSGEEAPLNTTIRDFFGRETNVPLEWAAAQRLESTQKRVPHGFDYFWRGTDRDIYNEGIIKTKYDALFGGNYDLVTSGYNAGNWTGGAPVRLSTDRIKDPNTLLLAVPKGTIKDLGNFNGASYKYLPNKSMESLLKVSEYNKLYKKILDKKATREDISRFNDIIYWFQSHPYNFNGELANSTDDIAEILVEQSNKLPYSGVLLRGIRDGGIDGLGNSVPGNDIIYNFHKIAPKVVSPYSTFEFDWTNGSYLKQGGKLNDK